MVTIPKEVLIFPARGDRRVGFQFSVVAPGNPPEFNFGFTDGSTGTFYAIAHAVKSFENAEEGYEEGDDNRRAAMHLTVELGLHIAAADGHIAPEESKVIKDWMGKAIQMVSEEAQKEEREKFKNAANEAYKRTRSGESDIPDVIRRMNAAANTQERYGALELCMDVMAADGKADPKEMQELDRLATMLRVDPNTYRSLREQRIAKIDDVGEVAGNLNTMLGITADMTPEQIKQHLTAEYRKWNSRVSHSDEKIRKRASEMLLLIGEARAKYVDD